MQIKKPLRILFCLLLLVFIIFSVASIPVSAIYGYIGGDTDDPVLFHPQINVQDRNNQPSTNLIQPTLGFINYNGTTLNAWNDFARGSIETVMNYYEGEGDGSYEWITTQTWKQTTSATTGLAVACTRLLFSNDYTIENYYSVTFYQDVIYLPYRYVDPALGSYDQGIVDAWLDFYISITDNYSYMDVSVYNVDIDYAVYAPQMFTNSSNSGGSISAEDVLLFRVNDLVDYRYLFTADLYEDVAVAMRDERGMRETKWIAIRDFKITCYVQTTEVKTGGLAKNSRVYVDVYQPLNVANGDGTYHDLTTFRSNDYFDHLKAYYSSEGGGVVSPPSQDSSFTDWIVNVIDSFFGVQLFGSFGLGDLMWFVVGVGVLFAVLKIFAGG